MDRFRGLGVGVCVAIGLDLDSIKVDAGLRWPLVGLDFVPVLMDSGLGRLLVGLDLNSFFRTPFLLPDKNISLLPKRVGVHTFHTFSHVWLFSKIAEKIFSRDSLSKRKFPLARSWCTSSWCI